MTDLRAKQATSGDLITNAPGYQRPEDFLANIRILPPGEGGRRSPPHNGIRWDLRYGDGPAGSGVFAIWPLFMAADGSTIIGPLETGITLNARMFILFPEMRDYHRRRLTVGTRFFCMEGNKSCAEGVVTEITGLLQDQ